MKHLATLLLIGLLCACSSGLHPTQVQSPTEGNIPLLLATQSAPPAPPQYEISYRYFPLTDEVGQTCVAQCEANYLACQRAEASAGLCDEEYHSCYRLCGGRIEQVTTCVANCDNIAR